jgi:hypothetical protein
MLFSIFTKCFCYWDSSIRYHFAQVDKRKFYLVVTGLLLFLGTYFCIPYNLAHLDRFLSEQISLYNIIDSYPQRFAYQMFVCFLLLAAILQVFSRKKTNDSGLITSKWISIIIGILILSCAITNLFISTLNMTSYIVLGATIGIALLAYSNKLRWISWACIFIFVLFAILPGFIHVPQPSLNAFSFFDQHYDMVMYRGRQLANGHLFFRDSPPSYSLLWSTFIGIFSKEIRVLSLGEIIRIVQIGQVLCLAAFFYAAYLRTSRFTNEGSAIAIVFFAVAVVPWLSTDGFGIWYPNQSGIRFLMIPIAICASHFIQKATPIAASIISGSIIGTALLANFETGITVAAGLGLCWLLYMRNRGVAVWLKAIACAALSLLSAFIILTAIYYFYFKTSPFPNNVKFGVSYLGLLTNGFAGLELPFRPLVFVIMAHAGYIFINSISVFFQKKDTVIDLMTVTIATMLLAWFPYYINRPDDWYLWTFIALYMLMIIPMFFDLRYSIIPFIISAFIVLPIAMRNLPYFIIDPLFAKQEITERQSNCEGIILPEVYCQHLHNRAVTLIQFSQKGSIMWSTSLPVMTDQVTHLKNIFWTGNLFGISITHDDFERIIQKITMIKPKYIFFDNPNDPFLKPRIQETSYNQKLFAALQKDYCQPHLVGEWLLAKQKDKGSC